MEFLENALHILLLFPLPLPFLPFFFLYSLVFAIPHTTSFKAFQSRLSLVLPYFHSSSIFRCVSTVYLEYSPFLTHNIPWSLSSFILYLFHYVSPDNSDDFIHPLSHPVPFPREKWDPSLCNLLSTLQGAISSWCSFPNRCKTLKCCETTYSSKSIKWWNVPHIVESRTLIIILCKITMLYTILK